MNTRIGLAAGLTAISALMLWVSFSFGAGRLEKAAQAAAKACNDAYWSCMGGCQDRGGGAGRGACELGCYFQLRVCRDKANLPRTTTAPSPPQVNPGTSATPKHRIDAGKVGVAGIAASATPTRRRQDLDAHKTLVAPTKSSPTPSPKPTVSRKPSN